MHFGPFYPVFLVHISGDADGAQASANARKRAEDFVKGTNVPLTALPLTKEAVSSATGRPGCSMAVFTDKGLAAAFLKALAAEYGEDYSPLAELLG